MLPFPSSVEGLNRFLQRLQIQWRNGSIKRQQVSFQPLSRALRTIRDAIRTTLGKGSYNPSLFAPR